MALDVAIVGIGMTPVRRKSTDSLRRLGAQAIRAALRDAVVSIEPASSIGWFATIPTDLPFNRAKPITMFLAYCACTSKK